MAALWKALPSTCRGGYAKKGCGAADPMSSPPFAAAAVMIKGSFGSRMGPIVKALVRRYAAPAAPDPAHDRVQVQG